LADFPNVDCGQAVSGRQRDDQIAMKRRGRARRLDQTAIDRTIVTSKSASLREPGTPSVTRRATR